MSDEIKTGTERLTIDNSSAAPMHKAIEFAHGIVAKGKTDRYNGLPCYDKKTHIAAYGIVVYSTASPKSGKLEIYDCECDECLTTKNSSGL